MEVMFDRVAGLDVGKATLTVCLRTPGPTGRRRRHTLVRVSPLRCMARGLRLPLDCCYEHAGLCPGRGPSGPAP